MPFSDIIGHEKQLAALGRALEQERLHHAYLFLGLEGVGKKSVALSLAKAVHCRELQHDFCGRCASCVKIDNRNHPDVRVVSLLADKKDISIDQVRALERELNYRAFSGGKKIAIIDPAALMNLPAQNALLKTLEEPPGGSMLILISTHTGGLLSTVLSRCLRLSFAPLPARKVADYLVSHRGLKPEEAALRAAVSLGSLGRALSPDAQELAQKRKAWLDRVASLEKGEAVGWAALAEEVSKDREEALKFLEWLGWWYRDLLIYRVTESDREVCNLDLIEGLRHQAGSHSLERTLFLCSQAVVTAARIRRNVNRRMAMENLLAQMALRK